MKIGTDILNKLTEFKAEPLNSSAKITKAADVLGTLKENFMRNWNMSSEDAGKLLAAMWYGEAQTRGQDPTQSYNDLPQPLKNVITYTPEDLKRQQNITTLGTAISIGAFSAAGVAALTGVGLPVAGALVGLGVISQMVVNNINDVFHWGPLMAQQNQQDIQKTADKIKISGITDYGNITQDDINKLSEAYIKASIPGFVSPFSKQFYPNTPEGVANALKELVGKLNVAGEAPTPSEAVELLSGWALPTTDRSGKEIVESSKLSITGGAGMVSGKELLTRITAKPKLFLGTILAGRVGPISLFTRQRDDEITSDADLLLDVQTNLARWLQTLPGKLTFTIDIKSNPIDENNVKLPGTWAVLSIYINNEYNKALFLEDVILGPLNPLTYYPETQRVVEVLGQLPDFTKYAPIEAGEMYKTAIVPGAFTPIPGQVGTFAPTPAAAPAVPAAPAAAPAVPAAPAAAPITALTPPQATPQNYQDLLTYLRNQGRTAEADYLETLRKKGASYPTTLEQFNSAFSPENRALWGLPAAPVEAKKEVPIGQTILPRLITVNVNSVHVRAEPNSTSALAGSQHLYEGNQFIAIGWQTGENVSGENRWWISQFGNFVWVGGTQEKP